MSQPGGAEPEDPNQTPVGARQRHAELSADINENNYRYTCWTRR